MDKILNLIDKFEEKNNRSCVEIRVFSDGSGTVNEYGIELFYFGTLDCLIQWMEG